MSTSDEKLKSLGIRLQSERLRRNESQEIFAARIGVSRPTLRKMESGDSKVLIGYWAAALDILDRTDDLDAILALPEDLFAKYDLSRSSQTRQRARRRSQ